MMTLTVGVIGCGLLGVYHFVEQLASMLEEELVSLLPEKLISQASEIAQKVIRELVKD